MTATANRRVGLPPWAERAGPDPHAPVISTPDHLERIAHGATAIHAWLHLSGQPRARLLTRNGSLVTAHALAADLFLDLYANPPRRSTRPPLTLWLENTTAIADASRLDGYTGDATHIAQSNGRIQTWRL